MKWFILFLSLPLIEIFVFLKVNEIIGMLYTLSIIISTALIGAYFVRDQALTVFMALKNQQSNPFLLISHGLIILVAGLLLVTPGFITDILGAIILVPSIRNIIITELKKKSFKF